MTALSEFTDYQNMSPPIYLRGPSEMVNDAIVQVPLLGRLLLNRDMSQILKGGSTIRDTIKLNVTTTYKTFSPGAPYGGYGIRQSSSLNEIRWRYNRDHMAWTEAEIESNIPGGQTAQARGGASPCLRPLPPSPPRARWRGGPGQASPVPTCSLWF